MINCVPGWRPPATRDLRPEAPQDVESVLLPTQKSRDVEMIVVRDRSALNGSGVRVVTARGAHRLRALRNALRLGRRQGLGPLKRRHWRRRDVRGRRNLSVMLCYAEGGQLLQQ